MPAQRNLGSDVQNSIFAGIGVSILPDGWPRKLNSVRLSPPRKRLHRSYRRRLPLHLHHRRHLRRPFLPFRLGLRHRDRAQRPAGRYFPRGQGRRWHVPECRGLGPAPPSPADGWRVRGPEADDRPALSPRTQRREPHCGFASPGFSSIRPAAASLPDTGPPVPPRIDGARSGCR